MDRRPNNLILSSNYHNTLYHKEKFLKAFITHSLNFTIQPSIHRYVCYTILPGWEALLQENQWPFSAKPNFSFLILSIYIYIYIYRERERERERKTL